MAILGSFHVLHAMLFPLAGYLQVALDILKRFLMVQTAAVVLGVVVRVNL